MARIITTSGVTINAGNTWTSSAIDAKNSRWLKVFIKATLSAALTTNRVVDVHCQFSWDGVNYSDIFSGTFASSLDGKVEFKQGVTSVHGFSSHILLDPKPTASGVYLKVYLDNQTGVNISSADITLLFSQDLA